MKNKIIREEPCPKCGQVADLNKKGSWIHNILVALDQLGNAVANGNPDSTISARVGYFANAGISESKYPKYWKLLEKIINFAWWPLERNNHCKDAYEADPETHYPGRFIGKIIIFLISLVCSIIISTLLYPAWLIFPNIRSRYECENCGLIVKPKNIAQ